MLLQLQQQVQCNFADTGADESLARHLLPKGSPLSTCKAIYHDQKLQFSRSHTWIALEHESEEEEIDGEEEEKEEDADVDSDGESVEEVFELF